MLNPIACSQTIGYEPPKRTCTSALCFGAPQLRNGEEFYETICVHSSASPHGHAGARAWRDGSADELSAHEPSAHEPSAHDAQRADDGRQYDGEPFRIG